MKLLRAFVAGAALAVSGAALADPAITLAPTSLHVSPGAKARVLLHIPANAEVDVVSCRGGWCEISWRNQFGYAPQRNLDLGAIPEDGPSARGPYRGPVYAEPPVYDYPPPAVYGGGIYIGPRPRVWGYGW